jgi:DNA-binding transcriptional LysR family regulator
MPDLNWNAVYGFWLVATHGSFAEAARALPRGSVQALHKRVRQLEAKGNLDLTLFRSRGVKGVQLTEAGRQLKEMLDPIFRSFDLLAADLRGEASGVLKVAMSGHVAYNYAAGLLGKFHRKCPAVSLELLERPLVEVISLAEEGRVDFGLGSPPLGYSPLKVGCRVPLRLEFLALPKHGLGRGPVTWREIVREPLILPERGTRIRQAFDSFMVRQHNFFHSEVRIAGEATSGELAIAAVKSGLGVALAPMGPRLVKHVRGLTRITPPPGLPGVDVGVFFREDRYMPRFMKVFLEVAAEVLQAPWSR